MKLSKRLVESMTQINMMGPSVILSDSNSYPRRIFWFLLTGFSIGLAITQIIKVLTTFLGLPVAVDITMKQDATIDFPTVIICNEEPKGATIFPDYGLQPMAVVTNITECLFHDNYTSEDCYQPFTDEQLDQNIFDWQAMEALFYHQYVSMISHCTFKSRDCQGVINARAYVTNDLFGCIQLNHPNATTGELAKTGEGHAQGLALSLVDISADSLKFPFDVYGDGYQVIVNNGEQVWYAKNLGWKVGKGQEVYIQLTREDTELLSAKTGCTNDGQLVEAFADTKYTFKGCVYECIEEEAAKLCSYTLASNTSEQKLTVRQSACRNFAVPSFFSQYIPNDCHTLCKFPCKQTKYTPVVTSTGISKIKYSDHQPETENTTTQIYIYMDTTSYKVVTQKRASTIWSLMSEVGGALGLMLGSTLLTLVQIVEFFGIALCEHSKHSSNGDQAKCSAASVRSVPVKPRSSS